MKEILEFALQNPDAVEHVDIKLKAGAIPKLFESQLWPRAVNPSLIIDESDEKQVATRAKSIVRTFLPDLSGKKFLDFGSGTSKIADHVENAAVAVSYDVAESLGVLTDWNVVIEHKYDVILMYDVIDHMTSDGKLVGWNGVIEILKQLVEDALAPDGVIYCRLHPWTSRHGTHNYLLDNKAYGHFVNGQNIGMPTIVTKEPVNQYKDIFAKSGLNMTKTNLFRQPIPPIFNDPVFDSWSREIFTWRNSKIFREVMNINFVDCVLERC